MAFDTILTANFNTLPEGFQQILTDGGITFSNISWPDGTSYIGGGSAAVDNIGSNYEPYLGSFAGQNVLGFNALSPGPDFAYGRFGAVTMRFGGLGNKVSLDVISGGFTSSNNTLKLEAYRNGVVVATDAALLSSFQPIVTGGFAYQRQFQLDNVVFDELRLSSSGPDEQGASFIIMDNVTVTAELPPPLPTLSINNPTFTEGNNGTTYANFIVTRTGTALNPISVNYATANNTAYSGSDYIATSGSLYFNTNETVKYITVPVVNDNFLESNESFFVNLSNATNATLGTAQGIGTILNDDASVSLSVYPSSVSEDGNTHLTYNFYRTGYLSNALTVNFNVGGTATFNNDYIPVGASSFTPTTGSVTFAPNSSTAVVMIDPIADSIVEDNETLSLTLVNGSSYTSNTPNPVTGTILNDDIVTNRRVLFADSFANNNAGWTLGPEWQIGAARSSTGHVYGKADPSLDFTPTGDNGVAGVMIGGNASKVLHDYYYLTSPVVDTTSASNLFLEYYRWLNSDYTPYMKNTIDIYNGSTWVNLWSSGAAPGVQDSAWQKQNFDITAYKGATTQIRFGFNITSSGVFSVSSWNVDDFSISTDI